MANAIMAIKTFLSAQAMLQMENLKQAEKREKRTKKQEAKE